MRFAIVAVCATALFVSGVSAVPLGGAADGPGQATVAKKKKCKKKRKRCRKRPAPASPVAAPVTPPATAVPAPPPVPGQQTLTVAKTGNGSGTVTSTPAGIDCGATCAAYFAEGSTVTLTPAPATGSTFTSWGGACSGSGACTVSMTQAQSVSATFTLNRYPLSVSTAGNGAGAVTSSPGSIGCPGTCSEDFDHGTSVTLTATPNATSSNFTGWGGACSGTGACTVSMTQARSVTATFTLKRWALSMNTAGNGSGGVTSSPGSINCPGTCSEDFDHGTSVTLTPTPNATTSNFAGWGGACSGTGACTVSMTQARSVTATFTLKRWALSVTNAGNGSGAVTSSPGSINCPGTCSQDFDHGTSVTLTPTPNATSSNFTGWGGACSGTGACTVSMTQARSVTATFTLKRWTLTTARAGNGSGAVTSSPGSINCPGTCSQDFDHGTSVTLTATPNATSSNFTGWGGACSGTGACTVSMTQARSVTATFTLKRWALSVTESGNGGGDVTSSPGSISCPDVCSQDFDHGTSVTLTASPNAGSSLAGWGGACSGTGACTVSMTQARSVTATFTLISGYSPSLNNGVVRVGIDPTNMGGAITYLSEASSATNLINIHDRGRGVQQSYYAGNAVNRSAEGQHPAYSPWPWNPITAGDVFGNTSPVIASRITPTTMYVKTRPLLWDMPGAQCECVFETWLTLEGRGVRVHNKLTTTRTDNRWEVVTRDQELPAVYPIAQLRRVVSYTGGQPFTGAPTSDIPDDPNAFWSSWSTLESWGACADTGSFGVGVYTPGRTRFLGGLYGSPSGGSTADSTCYLTPIEYVPLDKSSTFEYDYWLAVGTLDQIRQKAYSLHQSIPAPPAGFPAGDSQAWNFNANGDFGGWTPTSNIGSSSVSGGALNATSNGSDPYMYSAVIEKPAADNKVVVRIGNGTPSTTAQLFFTTAADGNWDQAKSKRITTSANSGYTTYTFDMSTVPGWAGKITRLRLDPAEASGTFAVDWIRIGNY